MLINHSRNTRENKMLVKFFLAFLAVTVGFILLRIQMLPFSPFVTSIQLFKGF